VYIYKDRLWLDSNSAVRNFLCRHPFDSSKWGRICKYLTKEGYLQKNRVVEPLEATKEDLLVVMVASDPDYLVPLACFPPPQSLLHGFD
jgi:hypothetical protein